MVDVIEDMEQQKTVIGKNFVKLNIKSNTRNAPLAQLEVASVLHTEGRKFDSYRVY